MKILVLNSGSSSVKYKLIDLKGEDAETLAEGGVEKIGLPGGFLKFKRADGSKDIVELGHIDHQDAVKAILNILTDAKEGCIKSYGEIDAVGHRVVHGGEKFSESVLIDDAVKAKIRECYDIAPLHNPANMTGIDAITALMPDVPQVGVFDTAFHQTMPEENYIYPIPYEYYEKDHIRRYGMHGTSHKYLTERLAEILDKPVEEMNIITCHLGNGGSITAVKNGKSFKTSMGFTPLSGIMMGTRSGDIDPAILVYLQKQYGYTAQELDDILNKKSGMLGVSGISSDSRDIENAAEEGNERAILTQKIFADRIIETVAGYYGLMGGADAIVFAGGIGENAAGVREMVCDGLKAIGVELDHEKNNVRGREVLLSPEDAKVKVWLIPTNEEVVLARDAYKDLLNA